MPIVFCSVETSNERPQMPVAFAFSGAMIVTGKSSEAADAIASFGTLLRSARVPGVTAVSGKASGFSVSSSQLGGKPIVVVAKEDRIAIGYGLAPALAVLNGGSGATLSSTPGYKSAVSAPTSASAGVRATKWRPRN